MGGLGGVGGVDGFGAKAAPSHLACIWCVVRTKELSLSINLKVPYDTLCALRANVTLTHSPIIHILANETTMY